MPLDSYHIKNLTIWLHAMDGTLCLDEQTTIFLATMIGLFSLS